MFGKLIAWAVAGRVLVLSAAAQIALPPEVAKKLANPKDRDKQLQRLKAQFRKHSGNIVKCRQIARSIRRTDPRALTPLAGLVGEQAGAERRDYLKGFYQQAQSGARAKARSAGPKLIENCRTALLRREVTVAALKAKAGPAMDALRRAATVSAKDVLAASLQLRKRRLEAVEWAKFAREMAGAKGKGRADPAPPDPAKALRRDEEMLALMATPMKPPDRQVVEGNFKIRGKAQPQEALGLTDLNVMRVLIDLPACRIDPKLCDVARDHAADMHRLKFFSHISPVTGKRTPWDRARKAGTSVIGECIAFGKPSGPWAVRRWFFSPGHHRTIFSRHAKRFGLGQCKGRWTFLIGR